MSQEPTTTKQSARNIEGIFLTFPTPLTKDFTLDVSALQNLTTYFSNRPIQGISILGRWGEAPYLKFETQKQVIETVGGSLKESRSLWVEIQSQSTLEAVELAVTAKSSGASGIILNIPWYENHPIPSILQHLHLVHQKSSGLPLLIRLESPRFFEWQSMGLFEHLARFEAVSGFIGHYHTRAHLSTYVRLCHRRKRQYFTDCCFHLFEALQHGADGGFCPISIIMFQDIIELYQKSVEGKKEESKKIAQRLESLQSVIRYTTHSKTQGLSCFWRFQKGSARFPEAYERHELSFIKQILQLQGHQIQATVSPPYPQISDEEKKLLVQQLSKLGII